MVGGLANIRVIPHPCRSLTDTPTSVLTSLLLRCFTFLTIRISLCITLATSENTMITPVLPLLFSLLPSLISALEVSANSPCASVCDGPSNTFPANLTCIDNNYSATDAGSVFRACLQCEASSTAVDGTRNAPQNNDVYWFLCASAHATPTSRPGY